MDSFDARTVMAARIARECPGAMRPPGESVAAPPGPVAAPRPAPSGSLGLGRTAGYKGWDGLPRRSLFGSVLTLLVSGH